MKKYIGIDIGDGESCVCVLPQNSQIEPRPIKVTGKESYLSAVADGPDGVPVIGMDAIRENVSKGFSVRFKSRILRGDEKPREDMRRFLTGLYNVLQRDGVLTEDCEIAIGCPAGWQSETRQWYRQMIESVGFRSPHIVSESRAAFLYAKHARTIQLDPSLIESSALVIDIGSSTLDFAYVVDGCESNVGTFGDVYLGGGAIDEALLQAAVNESSHRAEIRAVFEDAPEWRSHCLLAARRLKEEYFTRQARGEKNIQASELLTIYYDEPLPLKLQANEQLIWRVVNVSIEALGGISFYKMLKNALDFAFEETKARPPRLVLLTGGASRMLFFQDLCRKRFPDAAFALCEEPEFSIAKGLAYSVRVDKNIQAFNEAIHQYIQETHIRNIVEKHEEALIPRMAELMSEIGYHEAKEHLHVWREGGYKTLSDMNRGLQQGVSAALKNAAARKEILDLIGNEVNGICAELQPQIDRICGCYGIPSGVMRLQDLKLAFTVSPSTDVKVDIQFLRRSVQVIITGVAALIMLQIPGLQLVELVLASLAAIMGRGFIDSMTEKAYIPLAVRARIPVDRLISGKVRTKMLDDFQRALSAESSFRAELAVNLESLIVDFVSGMARAYEIRITRSE